MIMGSAVSDNVLGNDPTSESTSSSVFSNVIQSLATDTAAVYRAINAPTGPTYQQQQQSKQSTLLIVGVLLIAGVIVWHMTQN